MGQGREAQPEGDTAFTTVPQGAYVWTCDTMNSSCMLLNLTGRFLKHGVLLWLLVLRLLLSGACCVLACTAVHSRSFSL